MVTPPRTVIRVLINLSGAFLLFQQEIPGEKSSSTKIKQVSMCCPASTIIWNARIVAFHSNPTTCRFFSFIATASGSEKPKNIQDCSKTSIPLVFPGFRTDVSVNNMWYVLAWRIQNNVKKTSCKGFLKYICTFLLM